MGLDRTITRRALTLSAAVLTALTVSLSNASLDASAMTLARADGGAQPIRNTGARVVWVRDLWVPDWGDQRVMFYGPADHTRGVIIMFPGGDGYVGIGEDGSVTNNKNFVIRTRENWARRNFAVLIVDGVPGRSLRGTRSSRVYGNVTEAVLTLARSLTSLPIWVMGTSQGSIAAMNAAAHARRQTIAGVVLTESVSVPGKSTETVFDADPSDVEVAALVVSNRRDACRVAPPWMAARIAKSMKHAHVDLIYEDGGVQNSSNVCGSMSPHGYWGMDERVIDDIERWMNQVA